MILSDFGVIWVIWGRFWGDFRMIGAISGVYREFLRNLGHFGDFLDISG